MFRDLIEQFVTRKRNKIRRRRTRPARRDAFRIDLMRRLQLEQLEDRRLLAFDTGDAPDSYQTLLDAFNPGSDGIDGPSHTIVAGFHLGATIDANGDGQPSALATADDAVTDDEDGVQVLAPLLSFAGNPGRGIIEVVASQAGMLDAWIDYNQDGVFDHPAERVEVAGEPPGSIALGAGSNLLQVNVPQAAPFGDTIARFRFSSAGGLGPDDGAGGGPAPDGEVEDYIVTIFDGDNPQIHQYDFSTGLVEVGLPLGLGTELAPTAGEMTVLVYSAGAQGAAGTNQNGQEFLAIE